MKIYPRLSDFLNRTIEIPYSNGFEKYSTKWGKKLNLPNDEVGVSPPTPLIGQVVDKEQPPFAQGNFKAARWKKGVARKDLVFQTMEWNKELWSTSYDWKIKLVESITIVRSKEGKMFEEILEAGREIYVNLTFAQNKKMLEALDGERGVKVMPVKISIQKRDGSSGNAIVFHSVGADVQNQEPQQAKQAQQQAENQNPQPAAEQHKPLDEFSNVDF